MNYETYRDHLNNLQITIEELKEQLRMEEKEKEPVFEIGQYALTDMYEEFTGKKLYKYTDDDGIKKFATADDLLNGLDTMMFEYEKLKEKIER